MNCQEHSHNLELIKSLDDPDPDLQDTIKHIKECPECREIFTVSKDLDNLIYERMNDVEVPSHLRSKVKANLSPSRVPSSPFDWSLVWALTILVFASSIVSAVIYFNQIKMMDRLESLTAASGENPAINPAFSRRIKQDKNIREKTIELAGASEEKEPLESSHNAILQLIAINAIKRHKNILGSKFVVFDNNEVNAEFKKRFKFPITLPDFSKNLKLVGGSKCHSCSYEMAYLLYREGREGVSLCIFPASDFGLEKWSGLPETVRRNGHNVAIWKKNDNVYVMVFKIPVSEIKMMVCDLQKK